MPLFAKILAILNVLAAGGFIYLASLDYGARQAWALANFQYELALDGLPLDDRDPGRNVIKPLRDDLGDDDSPGVLAGLFKAGGVGKPFVKTQAKELARVQAALAKELAELQEDQRRQRIRQLLLALASTFAEHNKIVEQTRNPDVTTAEMEKQLKAKSEEAAANRRAAAHLLYNIDPSIESHQRLTVIIGLRAYANEAEEQARALREMADRIRVAADDDRILFEDKYLRNRERILDLVLQLERQQSDHIAQQRLVQRIDEEIIKPQTARIEDLKAEKEKVDLAAKDRLKQQGELENELFNVHRQMSNLLEENLRMEREIRDRELGRNRGGRQ
jgi:hypothetical protein